MKNKIIFMLKANTLTVFHSHWYNFADMKPLIFVIGSVLKTVSKTTFGIFTERQPRGKQKSLQTSVFFSCAGGKLGGRV